MAVKLISVVAACALLCAAQPVQQLPTLKNLPSEVLFRPGNPTLLECVTENSEKNIKYSWQKNGKLFDHTSNPDISRRENEGSLMFQKPVEADEGEYQCFAQSDSGIASSGITNFKKTYINAPTVKLAKHKPADGKPFKLDCTIPQAYPVPTIVWKRQLVSDPSVSENILDRRITLGPDGVLYFTNVTEEDVSTKNKYVCVGQTPASDKDVVLAEHLIEGLDNNKDKNGELFPLYVSTDMVGKVGKVTMIYCIYGGTPLAYPDWYKDGKNVNGKPSDRVTRHNRTSGKRLLIKETILEDEGTYTCKVNNEVGKPQEHSMKLRVVSAPQFATKPEKQVLTKEGQDVTVPCGVTGLPSPTVAWTYNAKPLTSNDRVSVSPAGLTIKKMQKSDTGYYGCSAKNEHGQIYAESLVYVA